MKPLGLRLFLYFLSFSLGSIANAEVFELNTSVRALGMGNAYVSMVRDSDAIFYNPSVLGMSQRYYWTIADPRVGLSGLDALQDLQAFLDPSTFAAALTALAGKRYWAGGGAKSSIEIGYIALGVYGGFDASLGIDDPASPEMVVNYVNDLGYAFGVGFPVLPFMYFGLTARSVTRTGNRTSFDSVALATLNQTTFMAAIENKGKGLALDAGFTFAFDTPIAPAISLVAKNIGTTAYTGIEGKDAPPNDLQELILGASMASDFLLFSVTPSIDIKHLDNSSIKFNEKLHIGVELGFPLIDLRAGLNQTYWTAGVGVGLGPIQVDAATFGQEVGTADEKKEERRYVVSLTIEFGIDAGSGGNRNGQGGEIKNRRRRHNLKQRR